MFKISVVTISFNQVEFLQECIDSVMNQGYPNIEYIIVDPGSTDGSRELIEKNKDKFSEIILEPDKGPADGLNKGFARATGDIYYFLNSDDVVSHGTFSRIIEVFELKPDIDVIYGNGYKIDRNGKIFKKVIADKFYLHAYAYDTVTFIQQSVFFKEKCFKAIGGFNSGNKITWDGELLVDFALKKFRFFYLDEFISKFRWYDNSISGSGNFKDVYKADRDRLFEKIMKRKKKKVDKIMKLILLINKYLFRPSKLVTKIFD